MTSMMDENMTRYQEWYEKIISEAEKKRSEGSGEVSTSNTGCLDTKLDVLIRRLQASTAMVVDEEELTPLLNTMRAEIVAALQEIMSGEVEQWMFQGVAAMIVFLRRFVQSTTSMLSMPQKINPPAETTPTPSTQQHAMTTMMATLMQQLTAVQQAQLKLQKENHAYARFNN